MPSFCETDIMKETSNEFLNELKQNSLFQKLVYYLKKNLITEENDLLTLKISEPMNYQIIYKTDNGLINFNNMSFEEKKQFVVKLICKMTNLSHPNQKFCDWSTESMPLDVSKEIVISFLNHIEFDIICSRLDGYKSIKEILDVIFNPYGC